jgi:hypothetical protein
MVRKVFDNTKSSTCEGLILSMPIIGNQAFHERDNLTNEIPNHFNYSSINGVLFNKDRTKLIQCPISKTGEYTIPSSVISVESLAFFKCSGLTSVTIPSSVKSIGAMAFCKCSGLISITFLSSLNSIGDWAFQGCTGLKSIHVTDSFRFDLHCPPNVFENVNKTICTLHVPAGNKSDCQSVGPWKDFIKIG